MISVWSSWNWDSLFCFLWSWDGVFCPVLASLARDGNLFGSRILSTDAWIVGNFENPQIIDATSPESGTSISTFIGELNGVEERHWRALLTYASALPQFHLINAVLTQTIIYRVSSVSNESVKQNFQTQNTVSSQDHQILKFRNWIHKLRTMRSGPFILISFIVGVWASADKSKSEKSPVKLKISHYLFPFWNSNLRSIEVKAGNKVSPSPIWLSFWVDGIR